MSAKTKRIAPRTSFDETPPVRSERRPRLASEPTSRHRKLSDRWEPGFLRVPGGDDASPLSYVVDGLGIYWDATAPSELELMIEEGGWENDALVGRARRGMADLRRFRLSVDNDPRRLDLASALARAGMAPDDTRPIVAVVDQPEGDPAVGFGLAGPSRFIRMLDAAIRENPGALVAVVADPAAVAVGGKPGHLHDAATARGAVLVRDPVEPWSVVESARRIYVVTSHLGFEAAMAGGRPACFGVPFYSGWGFTDDRMIPPRRTRTRSVAEVFAAAYLLYARYFDPFDGRNARFEDAVEVLRVVVERNRENAARTVCLGFAAWKRSWLDRTLGTPGHVPQMIEGPTVSPDDLARAERVVVWSSRAPSGTEEACLAAGKPLIRMEDGFLRSIGLGVALRPGASYVLDGRGVYYDANGPSDLEHLLETYPFDEALLERAARLREQIVAARLSKYNVGAAAVPATPHTGPLVLVAGQVEDDASIKRGAVSVTGNADLLRVARERDPDAVIAYKPHPDVEAGLRPGHIPTTDLQTLADVVFRDVPAPDAIEVADRVEVMTSLIGFEALMRGKPVTTHGLPFYAGWGLTESPPCSRRTRKLTVDELVAGALILYPRYVDPITGLPCSAEALVRRFGTSDGDLTPPERTPEAYAKSFWSAVWKGLLRR